jgi:alpha-tubulin suppressor-like RCC1 family protein
MKLIPRDSRYATFTRRSVFAVVASALIPLLLYAAAPSWWSQRDVLVQNAMPDDYAPVNQGQLKNIAKAAAAEMDARLDNGAGNDLHSLISNWSISGSPSNDFAPVNLGQLKSVAKPFYDRMISAGLIDYYPWLTSPNPADDFAVANIGQLKNLFGFDIPNANTLDARFGDRLAAGVAALALEAHAVWIWGDQLSEGSNFYRNYPRRINGLSGISSVSAGMRHFVVLGTGGTVWTWGENASGQLGDGTNVNRNTPAPLSSLANIASVKAGGLHTLALQPDGTVLAWGDNRYGQLGSGDTVNSASPAAVPNLNDVRKIAVGYRQSLALKNDGTVWIWGFDHYAWETGHNFFNTTPVEVSGLTDVMDITAGYSHFVAVKADGTVWAWGSNSANQIANGNPWSILQSTPFQVPNLSNVAKVASSYDHTLAILTDGTVWAWGANMFGQLGDGTNQARLTPVQVSGLTDVVAIATAYSYSLAMKSDGTVWAWGDGASGTLPGTDRYIPQQVGLGLFDSNHNGMDDRWEMEYFGDLDQAGDADFDGDGISNLQEYLHGTDPRDYFNGVVPVIEIVSGNNQLGDPGTLLPNPLTVRVRAVSGQLLVNAPVDFRISSGSGSIIVRTDGPLQDNLVARTDATGQSSAYVMLSQDSGTSARITASPSMPVSAATPDFVVFRVITRFIPEPTPAPTPDPTNPGPTPTASPTATPAAPYRYAVLDLGKNLYPIRVNNQGWVLLQGFDADYNWGYFRWKNGTLEGLTYQDANGEIGATDMNDAGTVVGWIQPGTEWVNNRENELRGGLEWAPNNRVATKVSSPVAVPSIDVRNPGTVRQASFDAINNQNAIYGEARTGVVTGFLYKPIPIVNAFLWQELAAPTALSFASASNDSSDPFMSYWEGTFDTVTRANSAGHYIGSKITPDPIIHGFLQGTGSGMIDGESIPFNPVDINEAGVVVGNSLQDGSMVIRTPNPSGSPPTGAATFTDTTLPGVSPIAVNDHVRSVRSVEPQPSPAPGPQPTPAPAPQIIGWAGAALVLWERQSDGKTWYPFGLEEMIPSMDGWDYLETADLNDNGMIAGIGWYTDPSNSRAEGETHAFLLVPVELMVDGNRDGEMSFDDPVIHGNDETTEEKPYRFWLNDDQDNVAIGTVPTSYGDGETVPVSNPNYNDLNIRTARDLEDWTRLWISFKGVIELIKAQDVTVELQFVASDGHPAIKVCQAFEADGGMRYITDANTANAQVSGKSDVVYGPISTVAALNLKDNAHSDWIDGLTDSNPTLHLLFEGAGEGRGKLQLKIKKNGQAIAQFPDLYLDIKNVRSMYERGKITLDAPDIPDPWNNDHPAPLQWAWDPWNWKPEIDPNATDQTIIYVHGWRMTYDEYLEWADTTFKRLFQFGYKGRFFSFHWPTFNGENNGVNPADLFVPGGTTYNPSEYRAWLSGPALASFVNGLPNPNARYLLAHSMGNVSAGAALRSGMAVTRYAMCNSAMAAMAYDSTVTDYNYETPDTDIDRGTRQTFGLANKLNPVGTDLVNFSLPADYALGQWSANNEFFKPQSFINHNYYYRSFNPPGRKLTYEGFTTVRLITSVPEAMAFVTQSRSAPAGTKLSTAGSVGSFVNMGQGGFNFGTEHSAEWVYDMQKTFPFWKEILRKFDVDVGNR